jgi:hypothetical protein
VFHHSNYQHPIDLVVVQKYQQHFYYVDLYLTVMKYQHLNLVFGVVVVVAVYFYQFHDNRLDYYHDYDLDFHHHHLFVFVEKYNYHFVVAVVDFENHLHFVEILIDYHEIYLEK